MAKGTKRALLVILLLLSVCRYVGAQDGDPVRLLKTGAYLALGATASFVVHESAHAAMATALGESQEWTHGDWICRACDGPHMRTIAASGFAAQALATELLLNTALLDGHPAKYGFIAFYVANSLGYVVANELRPDGYGDLANFRRQDQRLVEGLLFGHIVLTMVRVLGFDPAWPVFVESTGRDVLATVNLARW